jgi:hypothetical protein
MRQETNKWKDRNVTSLRNKVITIKYLMVKLSLHFIKHHAMKIYGAVEVQLHAFLPSSLTPVTLALGKESLVPTYRRLGAPQSQPGHCWYNKRPLSPTGNKLQSLGHLGKWFSTFFCSWPTSEFHSPLWPHPSYSLIIKNNIYNKYVLYQLHFYL